MCRICLQIMDIVYATFVCGNRVNIFELHRRSQMKKTAVSCVSLILEQLCIHVQYEASQHNWIPTLQIHQCWIQLHPHFEPAACQCSYDHKIPDQVSVSEGCGFTPRSRQEAHLHGFGNYFYMITAVNSFLGSFFKMAMILVLDFARGTSGFVFLVPLHFSKR